jgi:hypothetical protein
LELKNAYIAESFTAARSFVNVGLVEIRGKGYPVSFMGLKYIGCFKARPGAAFGFLRYFLETGIASVSGTAS